jgi:hypothetical protein
MNITLHRYMESKEESNEDKKTRSRKRRFIDTKLLR